MSFKQERRDLRNKIPGALTNTNTLLDVAIKIQQHERHTNRAIHSAINQRIKLLIDNYSSIDTALNDEDHTPDQQSIIDAFNALMRIEAVSRELKKIVILYLYVNGMKQTEIESCINVPRPTIAKYVKEAETLIREQSPDAFNV